MKDPALSAAFNAKFFVHGFMRDYRTNRNSPTFLEDQRRRLKKHDARIWAASLTQVPIPADKISPSLSSVPIPAPASSVPRAVPAPPAFSAPAPSTLITPSYPASKPHDTVVRKSTAAPKSSTVSAARNMPTASRDRSDGPVAGPGPRTTAITAAGRDIVTHKDLDKLERIDEDDREWRGFRGMVEDSSDGEAFRPSQNTADSSDSDDSRPRLMGKKKGKGKAVRMDNVKEKARRQEKPSRDQLRVIQVKSRLPVSPNPLVRPIAVPTGKYHDPPCSTCRINDRSCEIQESGGACVFCRRFKHKCDYARPRRPIKSTPVVESEDELHSDNPPSRHPRQAAATARRAIKEAAASSPKVSRPRVKGKFFGFIKSI